MEDEMTALIAKDLGIDGLKIEEQKVLIAQFGEVALKAATYAVVGKLNEEKQKEFMVLAEAGNADAIKAFLDAQVPGHEEIARVAVAEEVKRFKEFQKP